MVSLGNTSVTGTIYVADRAQFSFLDRA